MIEVTDEMVHAFFRAYADADDGSSKVILEQVAERAGLAAVLAIVERNWNMQPRPTGSHLPARRTVHLITDGSATTSCCGRTPVELPAAQHRLTIDREQATCQRETSTGSNASGGEAP